MSGQSVIREPQSAIAIVGIGCLFPKANGLGHFWANVKHGVDCIDEVPATHWNPADYFDADPKKPDMTYARRGGFLTPVDFNPLEFGIAPRDLEATDTSQLLGLVAAKQALNDAGIDFTKVKREKTSVILGVTGTLELVIPLGARLGHPKWKEALKDAGVPQDVAKDVIDRIGESYVPWQENSFPGLLGNVVAGRIANKLDLHGTNCVVDAACASSLSAVHLAAMELQTGKADVVVTGGADTFNDIFMFMCFSKTPALSPSGDSKPFDANGDGTILGEGLGMVVMKRLTDAEAAGDRIYAVLKGIGTSSDGKGNAIYAPSSEGQTRCLKDAYERAGVDPATVELVEAHGTGTKVGDAAEATGLTNVFQGSGVSGIGSKNQEGSYPIPHTPYPRTALGSVKSQIGHTKAAAGAASLIKVAMSLYNKVLPPTLKVTKPVEPLNTPDSPFYVNDSMRPWLPRAEHPRRAGLSAFGFGGSNFHAVLEEYDPKKAEPDWDGRVEILALSGDSAADVEKQLTGWDSWDAFARAAASSRRTFDASAKHRTVIVAERGKADLKSLGKSKSAYTGSGPAPGKLAVLFPGQGSQAVGMLRELACTFPEVLDSLAEANSVVPRLSDRIYPPNSFAPDAKQINEDALRATNVAQPALGAVSWGVWRLLNDRFDVNADGFAGHSYGEIVALAAAGRLTQSQLFELSKLRGELMAKEGAGDAGGMLAVLAPLADIEKIIREKKLGVVIANKNGPSQTVVSGSTADVEKATEAFAAARIRTVKLHVAAAFHSELVSEASKPFRKGLDPIAFPKGSAEVYANSTAKPYPEKAGAVRDLLGFQLAKPVEFVEQIQAMVKAGYRTFVEVGPGHTLTRLVESIVGEQAVALAIDSAKEPGSPALAHALARLAARGHAVNLVAWERESRCRPAELPAKPVMTVPIGGANYVQPRAKRPPAAPYRNGKASTAIAAPKGEGPRKMSDPQSPEFAQALQLSQQTLAAFQKMQEQTAQLHKQFLDQQDVAQRTLHALVAQQQALLFPGTASSPQIALPPMPAYVPPPPVAYAPPQPAPAPVAAKPAPAAPKTQPAAKPMATPPVPATGGIAEVLLAVVAEKTGYPVDMLNLDMTLDSDLGVDSIKRVEILSAIQDKLPSAPVVKPEHLGTLHSLKDVADYLAGGDGVPSTLRTMPEPPMTVAYSQLMNDVLEAVKPAGSGTDVAEVLLAVVAEKTGYPVDMLNLDMTLDSDLGVDSIKRVEILSAIQDKLPSAPVVKPEHLGTLHSLKDVADYLAGASNSEMTPKTEQLSAIKMPAVTDSILLAKNAVPVAQAPPTSTDYPARSASASRTGMGSPERIDRSVLQMMDLDLGAPRLRVNLAKGSEIWVIGNEEPLAREVLKQLQAQGYPAKLWPWADPDPIKPGGSPAGLLFVAPMKPSAGLAINRLAFRWLQTAGPKIRSSSRMGVVASVALMDGSFGVKDFDPDTDPAPGGLAGLVKTVRQEWPEVSAKAMDVAPAFAKADPKAAAAAVVDEFTMVGPVEVGIHSDHRCTLELARAVRRPGSNASTFGKQDVVLITGGARGVTAQVAVSLAETFHPTIVLTGRSPAPAGAEPDYLIGITDEAAMKAAIAQHLGSSATPKTVSDLYAKTAAHREIRETLQRIEAAGSKVAYFAADVSQPRAVADLLHRVQVKHGPITALVHGAGVLADRKIEDLTLEQFDSVYKTKVDGLKHLLDLLGAQELKALVLFSSTTARLGRTGQLAYAVANEVLNKTAQRESRRRPNCRVVAINWGPWDGGMVTPALRKVFEAENVGLIPLKDGGEFAIQELNVSGRPAEVIALGKVQAASRPAITLPPPPSQSAAAPVRAGADDLLPVFERTVELDTHPILRSHVIGGRAVLPMSLHMEWLAHAALHGNPGLVFHGFNEMRVTNGVMVGEGVPAQVRGFAGKAQKVEKGYVVAVELRGKRRDGREVLFSKAEVVLANSLPKPPAPAKRPAVHNYPHGIGEAYSQFLFHGEALHGIDRIDGVAEMALIGAVTPAPVPGEWYADPLRGGWLADPLVLDASFQLMILWSYSQHGAGSLPCFAGRYRQYVRAFPTGVVPVVIRITRDNGSFARSDIDYLDPDGNIVAQLQDYECVIDPQLNEVFRLNRLGAKTAPAMA